MRDAATIPQPPVPAAQLPALAAWLWQVVGGMRQVIAALGGRDRSAVPTVLLAWARVGRLAQRFEALLARLAAGTLKPPRLRTETRRGRVRADMRLPGGFGWLVRLTQDSAVYASLLQVLLDDPAMQALLASCPRAGRIIRPLKHMLGMAAPGAELRVTRPRPAWWQRAAAAPAAPVTPSPVGFWPGRPPPGWQE